MTPFSSAFARQERRASNGLPVVDTERAGTRHTRVAPTEQVCRCARERQSGRDEEMSDAGRTRTCPVTTALTQIAPYKSHDALLPYRDRPGRACLDGAPSSRVWLRLCERCSSVNSFGSIRVSEA